MVLINFSHPFTHEQLRQLEELARKKVERVIEVSAQIDPQQPIVPQIAAMADRTGLTPQEWQTTPLIINPPSLSISAVTLLAELHGRCGYFPAVVRLRPVASSVPPQFEMAEIVNLQAVREKSRKGR
ncbi:MAG TPA: CRISPR-associated protein Csx15 [Bacillota bacterium]|nr:CRISPR-associated protein Csx15 [Bacillota bacterium]